MNEFIYFTDLTDRFDWIVYLIGLMSWINLKHDRDQYNLEYYLNFARQLTELGIHVLAIKDMAGLLKPAAATTLVSTELESGGMG